MEESWNLLVDPNHPLHYKPEPTFTNGVNHYGVYSRYPPPTTAPQFNFGEGTSAYDPTQVNQFNSTLEEKLRDPLLDIDEDKVVGYLSSPEIEEILFPELSQQALPPSLQLPSSMNQMPSLHTIQQSQPQHLTQQLSQMKTNTPRQSPSAQNVTSPSHRYIY
jgi:hypothetical protein